MVVNRKHKIKLEFDVCQDFCLFLEDLVDAETPMSDFFWYTARGQRIDILILWSDEHASHPDEMYVRIHKFNSRWP